MLDRITWFQQSGYRWDGDGLTVYIDPWVVPDDSPPADVVFITHAHDDHYSSADLDRIRTDETTFVAPRDVARELSGNVTPVGPGDSTEVKGVKVQVVPAYNTEEDRLGFHPKANGWVGYVLDLGGSTYYHAGDTDHCSELDDVKAHVAFLPIGGTFTMDPFEAAGLAKAIGPQIAVPMHYGGYVEGVGTEADGETFRKAASPVTVELLPPVNPFRT